MPKYTWNSIRDKKEELQALIATIDQVDGVISSEADMRLQNLITQLRSLEEKPEQENAERIFNEGMEMLGDRIGYIKEEYKDKYGSIQNISGFQAMEDRLNLPQPGTAAFLAEAYRSVLADEQYVGNQAPELTMGSLALLYDRVKDAEDWRSVRISADEICNMKERTGPAIDLLTELVNHSEITMFNDLSPKNVIAMIQNQKNGKETGNLLYGAYVKGAPKRLEQRLKNGVDAITPKPYEPKEGLSPEEQAKRREDRVKKNKKYADKKAMELIADLLSCRAVMQFDPNDKEKSVLEAAGIGEKTDKTVMKYAPEFIESMPRKDLVKLIQKGMDGSALEAAFRQHIAQLDALPEGLPDTLRPTAKERIEALQRKIKSKETSAEQKRWFANEIIATREAVNAQRGGAGLDSKVPDGIGELTETVEKNMQLIFRGTSHPEKEYSKYILSAATSGHGGKMMETYQKNYGLRINRLSMHEDLPQDLDDRLMPTAKSRVEAMQVRLRNAPNLYDADELTEEAVKCLAGILAARENVDAKLGGKGLENKLKDVQLLTKRTRELEEALSVLDGQELDTLYQQALSGHGGKMKQTFESDAYQKKISEGLAARQRAAEEARLAEQRKADAEKKVMEGQKASLENLNERKAKSLKVVQERIHAERQKLENAKSPEEQELAVANLLYLNRVKDFGNPADQTKATKDESMQPEVEKLRSNEVYNKYFKKMVSKEALGEVQKGNEETLSAIWKNAVEKKNSFAKKMAEELEDLKKTQNKEARHNCVARILYLNDREENGRPDKQATWMKEENIRNASKAIQDSPAFRKFVDYGNNKEQEAGFMNAVNEAEHGNIKKLVDLWNDTALEVKESTLNQSGPSAQRTVDNKQVEANREEKKADGPLLSSVG